MRLINHSPTSAMLFVAVLILIGALNFKSLPFAYTIRHIPVLAALVKRLRAKARVTNKSLNQVNVFDLIDQKDIVHSYTLLPDDLDSDMHMNNAYV